MSSLLDPRTKAAIEAGHPEWAELPASRKEAKDMHYFTSKPCKRGHVSMRYKTDGRCAECDRAYQVTPDQQAYSRARQKMPAYRAYQRSYNKTPARRAYFRGYEAHRNALKLKATPPWLTDAHKAEMRAIYDEAARLTRETGIPHHVDHIVPLRATCHVTRKRIASGLHIPANLQVIPATENIRKNCWFNGGWS